MPATYDTMLFLFVIILADQDFACSDDDHITLDNAAWCQVRHSSDE